MSKIGIIKSVLNEYGLAWAINRVVYSTKIKTLSLFNATEGLYEKKTSYPNRLNIFDIDIDALKGFVITADEKSKENLIRIADNACKGIIRGFSSIDLNYGQPIDWQLNPLTGQRCSENIKWYKIPDFDRNRGDIKVIWEASRFSHFITLARAYILTEDVKYYEAFREQLNEWLRANRYSYGANYKCGQECSLRMVNALLAYSVFYKAGIVTDADTSNIKDLVDRCYRKVLSNFFYAHKCIKNNHTISELMGMIVGAWCCEDKKQIEKAYHILDDVIDEQFTEDGGYKQFSFNYQRLALQDMEVIFSLSKRIGKSIDEKNIGKIAKAVMLMYQCQDESGDMPNYGSNDGALIFPVTFCDYRDFRPVINTINALVNGNRLYRNGLHQEELIWFSNGKKIEEYPYKEVIRGSFGFNKAGLFTLRDKNSWMMMVSNDYKSRPAHMDQNHVDLWLQGKNILCDAGTYSYDSDTGRVLVKNISHNTVLVENRDQMNTYGPFMIYKWTQRKKIEFNENEAESTILSGNGYTHKRKLRKISNGYEIADIVDTGYKVLFHTSCDIVQNENELVLKNEGEDCCKISTTGTVSFKAAERSKYYLRKEPVTCIIIDGKKNNEVVTRIALN